VVAQVEAVKQSAAQAFIAWTTGSPSATILRDARQIGLDLPIATTAGNMTYAQMHNFAAFLPEKLYMPASEWPVDDDRRVTLPPPVAAKQLELYTAFRQAGQRVDEGTVVSWDPASIVVAALRALPDGATAQQLRDHLAQRQGQAGVAGIYDFVKVPQRGVSLDDVVITRWSKSADRWILASKPTGEPLPQQKQERQRQ
jgi:branched-chain amino acid transport system substrate-binding protein